MKSLILFVLCLSASAALPPPPIPTVKRPAPLLSPKHASAPKHAPMVKATAFTPAGYSGPLAPCFVTFTIDQMFFQDIVDITRVECLQRPGRNVVFEYCNDATGGSWGRMAFFGPCTVEQSVTVEWYHSINLRPSCRVFRVREEVVTGLRPASALTTQQVTLNPMFQLRTWTRPRK